MALLIENEQFVKVGFDLIVVATAPPWRFDAEPVTEFLLKEQSMNTEDD